MLSAGTPASSSRNTRSVNSLVLPVPALADTNTDATGSDARACAALAEDFTPLSDFRASKEYRLLTAQNLLRKFFLELQAPEVETRVTAYV